MTAVAKKFHEEFTAVETVFNDQDGSHAYSPREKGDCPSIFKGTVPFFALCLERHASISAKSACGSMGRTRNLAAPSARVSFWSCALHCDDEIRMNGTV